MIAKMMRRRLLLYSQAAVVLLLFIYLFVSYDSFSSGLDISHYSDSWRTGKQIADNGDKKAQVQLPAPTKTSPIAGKSSPTAIERPKEKVTTEPTSEDKPQEDVKEDKHISHEQEDAADKNKGPNEDNNQDKANTELMIKAREYARAIMDPADTSVPRMACPAVNSTRYEHLTVSRWDRKHKYFIALDLRKVMDLMPRLMGSVVEAIRFLGPRHTALSIVEGNSDDGTAEVLALLKPELEALGVEYFLVNSAIDPKDGGRIEKLAQLRSQALEPLRNSRNATAAALALPGSSLSFADDATVIFINDVALCAEDILELAHQRVAQGADMTCAMDWAYLSGLDEPPAFYDVWVARGITGDTFFEIPDDGSWAHALRPFERDPPTLARLAAHRPFQAFACWNGAVTFAARPVLERALDFRVSAKGECFQGEPQLFCKDMWWHGYGKIAVVPSVNLEYTDERGRHIKQDKGYASNWTAVEDEGDLPLRIDWAGPPDMVKCMPSFDRQSWLPWNESLA